MKKITYPNFECAILLLLLSSIPSLAQVNFSGAWQFDKARSSPEGDAAKYEGKIVREVTQNKTTIAYKDIYSRAGSADWSTADEIFTMDGKEQIEKHDRDEVKKFTRWSDDKKSLTLTYQSTYYERGVAKELVIAEKYTLSDNGKTLTINKLFKNPVTGETKTVNTYVRK